MDSATFRRIRPLSSGALGRWISASALFLAIALLPATSRSAGESHIVGAGSSFAAPIIESWGAAFAQEHAVQIQYHSVGSGDGIRSIAARSVDFAVTDVPLTQADLAKDDLVQYPLVVSAIVLVANLPAIGPAELRLSGPVVAQIFLGKISSWNAPELRSLNPGLDLPDLPIKVIHRSDTSGSTFVFTYYLSKVSSEWNDRLGIGSRVDWPHDDGVRGNEGVVQEASHTAGAIAYVERSRALGARLNAIRLSTTADQFVAPNEESISAAIAGAKFLRPSYYEILVNGGNGNAWPIVGISYVLLARTPTDPEAARHTVDFLSWIYRHGGQIARDIQYTPITDEKLIKRIESSLGEVRDSSGHRVLKGI